MDSERSSLRSRPDSKKRSALWNRLLTKPEQLREILRMGYHCSSVTLRHYDEIEAGLYLGDM